MSFKTEDKKVSDLLGKRVYLIPRNQRRYVWTIENWKDMLEDLEFSIQNSERPHFMGSIVLEKQENGDKGAGVEVFSIIDGQQRITTFLLYLATVMYLFKQRSEQNSFDGLKSYLITNNLANKLFPKLSSDRYPSFEVFVEKVCDWSQDYSSITHLIGESTSDSRSNKELFEAVRFFYEKLSSYSTEKIQSYRNALLDTNVVEIIATSEEDAYTIFEILNARGQILEDYELIKNYIMRYYEPSDAVDRAKYLWDTEILQPLGGHVSQFIKHYVTHRYAKSGNGHNFNYEIIKAETNKHQVIQLLEDLCRKAGYYKIIIDPKSGDDGNCSECEFNVYSFMKSNRGMLFRPMFLSLIHKYKTDKVSKDVYESVLVFIKHFFICYNLLGRLTSNKLTDTVQSSAKSLEDSCCADALRKFVNGLIKRLPTLDEFTKSFQSIGWSKINEFHKDSGQKRRVQVALETLEAIEVGTWSAAPYTIEHLHPDSADRKSANIGNLVMLEIELNERNADKKFIDKVGVYQDSGFKTTRNIFKRYHEKPSELNIDVRATAMAKKIYNYISMQESKLLALLDKEQDAKLV